jgi:hypothetical protein
MLTRCSDSVSPPTAFYRWCLQSEDNFSFYMWADVEACHLVVLFLIARTPSKYLFSLAMADVNSLPVLAYSDLTTHSPDTQSPYRRIHFPILESQQGCRELFLPSTEDRPIRPETIMAASDPTRFA